MKSLLLKLLVLTAVSTCLLSSCSHKSSDKDKAVSIEMWYAPTYSESGPPPADWFVYNLIKTKLNIDLVLKPLPSDSKSQTEMILQASSQNKLPDVFYTTGDALVKLIGDKKVAPVELLFDLMPVRTSHMYDRYSRTVFKSEGHTYALAQPSSINRNEGILIRKDWLDKLKLDIPVTTQDYLEVMRAFTLNDPDGNGKSDTYGYGAYLEIRREEEGLGRKFQPIFGAFGVEGTFCLKQISDYSDITSGPGLTLYKSGYYDAVSYVKQMVEERLIDPNWIAYSKEDFRKAWKSGRFGIMREQNAAYALEANYASFDKAFPEGEWIVIDPPKGPKGYSSIGPYTDSGHRLYAVSKEAQDNNKLGAVAKLLEWMSSEEGYHAIAYGQEYVNYTFDKAGNITTSGIPDEKYAYTKKEIQPLLQLRNLVFYNSEEELRLRYPEWTTINGKKLNAYEVLTDMRSRSWTDARGAENLPKADSELRKYWEQGVLDFVLGNRKLTPVNWENWLKGFDALGGRKWEKQCYDYALKHDLLKDNLTEK